MKYLIFLFLTLASSNLCAQELNDSTIILRLLKSDYGTMEDWNVQRHIANCTKDYLLIENGEVWNLDREIESYKSNANRVMVRKDYFSIRNIKVYGPIAYAVYELRSDITEKKVLLIKHWNESVIFRKVDGQWKIALIHSTPIQVSKQ